MKNFNAKNRGGGRRFGNSRGSDRQMHDAVCTNCGKDCQVPFKPTGTKPVLCGNCFKTNDDRSSHSRGERSFKGRDDSRQRKQPNYEMQLDDINKKLNKILALVENL